MTNLSLNQTVTEAQAIIFGLVKEVREAAQQKIFTTSQAKQIVDKLKDINKTLEGYKE